MYGSSVARQNVERYRRLLERVIEQPERQRILKLLAKEQQKKDDAIQFDLHGARLLPAFQASK